MFMRYFGAVGMAMRKLFMRRKDVKVLKIEHKIYIYHNCPVGQVQVFAGLLLVPGAYV